MAVKAVVEAVVEAWGNAPVTPRGPADTGVTAASTNPAPSRLAPPASSFPHCPAPCSSPLLPSPPAAPPTHHVRQVGSPVQVVGGRDVLAAAVGAPVDGGGQLGRGGVGGGGSTWGLAGQEAWKERERATAGLRRSEDGTKEVPACCLQPP